MAILKKVPFKKLAEKACGALGSNTDKGVLDGLSLPCGVTSFTHPKDTGITLHRTSETTARMYDENSKHNICTLYGQEVMFAPRIMDRYFARQGAVKEVSDELVERAKKMLKEMS